MFRLVLRWLITSLTILMLPSLVAGVTVRDFGAALAAAAVLGILNVIVKPLLIILTLPLTVLTLGLFLLFVNAIVFSFAGALVSGIHIASFGSAILASVIVSLVSWVTSSFGDKRLTVRTSRTGFSGGRPPRNIGGTLDMEQGEDGKWK